MERRQSTLRQCGRYIDRACPWLRKFSSARTISPPSHPHTKMSDKRRRRIQNSDDSEHSDSDGGDSKAGGEDLDLDKDEGVVSAVLCIVTWLSGAAASGDILLDPMHSAQPGPGYISSCINGLNTKAEAENPTLTDHH